MATHEHADVEDNEPLFSRSSPSTSPGQSPLVGSTAQANANSFSAADHSARESPTANASNGNSRAPAAVQHAIATFIPTEGFEVKARLPSETSFIFDYGVRVVFIDDDKPCQAWICLADDHCRRNKSNIFLLSAGRTSRAARHLRVVHSITSEKTEASLLVKRTRDNILDHLRASTLFLLSRLS